LEKVEQKVLKRRKSGEDVGGEFGSTFVKGGTK